MKKSKKDKRKKKRKASSSYDSEKSSDSDSDSSSESEPENKKKKTSPKKGVKLGEVPKATRTIGGVTVESPNVQFVESKPISQPVQT